MIKIKQLSFFWLTMLLTTALLKANAQSCSSCDFVLTPNGSGTLDVPSGQTYCLQSGTYNQSASWHGFTIENGGTLCIGAGATYYVGWTSNVQGTIVNHGTLNIAGISSTWNGHIENYGTITVNGSVSGDISGSINNHGMIIIHAGVNHFSSNLNNDTGALFNVMGNLQKVSGSINNYGNFRSQALTMTTSAYINNQDSFVVNNGSGGSVVQGTFDNSGYAYIHNLNGSLNGGHGLSATLNNYGVFKVEGALTIGEATYLTNDSLVVFNVPSVNFQGPLITNNGRINVLGNFDINNNQMEFVNNEMIYVTGSFNYNTGATGVNNCRIFAANGITINAGTFQNYGLLWSGQDLTLNSNSSVFTNEKTGFVRAKGLTISGTLKGFGKLYFTSSTSFDGGGGAITGDSATNKILFYTPSGSNPFPPNQLDQLVNVTFLPTSSITPLDTNNFDCNSASGPITTAGNPPQVRDSSILQLTPTSVTFHLITDHLITPYNNNYTIVWSSLKLFSVGGGENTTHLTVYNNSHTALGTFTVDTTNKAITFTPENGFTSGFVKVQFVVANVTSGNPINYTSRRATLTIHLNTTPSPLPIKIIEWTAKKDGNNVQLNWATAMESNCQGFQLERSANARHWQPIGFVYSKSKEGNSTRRLDYNYTDKSPLSGSNFYRLKEVDNNGDYIYSQVRMVDFSGTNRAVQIYPNPTENDITISGVSNNALIRVYDLTGRLLSRDKADSGTVKISLNALPEGTYQVVIINPSGSIQSKRIVKLK